MRKLTDEQIREIRARSAEGESQRRLAALYGVSPTTIGKVLKDEPTRFRGKQRSRLREKWASVDQAAAALGVDETRVIVMCAAGELAGTVRLGRGTWLIPWSSLPEKREQ